MKELDVFIDLCTDKELLNYISITDTNVKGFTKNLNNAYSRLHDLNNDISKQLLCTWSGKKGLKFYVVTQKTYKTKSEARETLTSLPLEMRSQIKILDLHEPNLGKQTYYLSKI